MVVLLVACGGQPPVVIDAGSTGGGGGTSELDAGAVDSGIPEVDAGPIEEPPVLTFTTSPVANLPAGTRFASAVPYGIDPEQIMDVFLPSSTAPTALVIYFHGGGFVAGSRTAGYNAVAQVTGAGIAWIGVDYRLLRTDGTEDEGVIKCLHDNRTALQFIRRWASTFNIDPTRIAIYGGSAGAGTSLWLATHPEMAIDGGSSIEGQSTRVRAAAALTTQATYDVLRWAPDVYSPEYPALTNDLLIAQAQLRETMVRFYGIDRSLASDAGALLTTLTAPPYVAYRADVDMLALMSADDPPIYLANDNADAAPGTADFDLLHHPRHGLTVLAFANDAGISTRANITAYGIDTTDGGSAIDFLIEHLQP